MGISGYAGGSVEYEYDDVSRLSRVIDPQADLEFDYEYQAGTGIVEAVNYRHGQNPAARLDKHLDLYGRVQSMEIKNAAGAAVKSLAYSFTPLGQRQTKQEEDGSYWAYRYDDLGQVTSAKKHLPGGDPLNGLQFEYSYDGIGNREWVNTNGRLDTYQANDLNQYTERTVAGAVDIMGEAEPVAAVTVNASPATRQGPYFHKELAVDNTSDPQWTEVTVETSLSAMDPATDQGNVYTPETPEVFTYDDDGNLLSDGRWTYIWNGENRLIQMASIATVPVDARKKLVFKYDWMGRRITKQVSDWNTYQGSYDYPTTTTHFFYVGWNLIAERGKVRY